MNPIGHDRIMVAGDLLQRPDTNHDAVVVDVPDRDRIARVVDPGAPVVRDRLGQDILSPAIGLGVEADDAARIHLARPDLTVLVGQAFVERYACGRRRIFDELFGLDVVFYEITAGPAKPGIAIGIEAAALGCGPRRAGLQLYRLAAFNVEEGHPVLRPGAACEIATVGAEFVAIGRRHLLEQELPDHLRGVGVDFVYGLAARVPDVAIGREREVAEARRIDRPAEVR